jgi:hypothetical protein
MSKPKLTKKKRKKSWKRRMLLLTRHTLMTFSNSLLAPRQTIAVTANSTDSENFKLVWTRRGKLQLCVRDMAVVKGLQKCLPFLNTSCFQAWKILQYGR